MRRFQLALLIVSVASVSIGQSVSVEDRYAQPENSSKCPDGLCCNETGKWSSVKAKSPWLCFPGSAMVMTRNGNSKSISDIAIGEEVASLSANGDVAYSAVYAHGHFDSNALSQFVVIKLSSLEFANESKTLELSPDHFIIVTEEGKALHYKRAKNVGVSDTMLATTDGRHFSSFYVSDVKMEMLKGLYNPYTLQGNIVVNDVLVSCHSDWFLDSTFDILHLTHMLPSTYEMLLAPLRMLYKRIGNDSYKSLYTNLDSHFDIARSSTSFGGYFKLLTTTLSSIFSTNADIGNFA